MRRRVRQSPYMRGLVGHDKVLAFILRAMKTEGFSSGAMRLAFVLFFVF